MTQWEWPGLFYLDVPHGWSVTQTSDLIEVLPDEPVGALQVSVLRRSDPESPSARGAEGLIQNFVEKQGGGIRSLRAERLDDDGYMASACFDAAGNDVGDLAWDVTAFLWDELGLICSYCHANSDNARRGEALQMLKTVRRSKS